MNKVAGRFVGFRLFVAFVVAVLVVLASAGVAYADPSKVQYGPRDGGNGGHGGHGGHGGGGGHHHHNGGNGGGPHHHHQHLGGGGGGNGGGGFGAFAQSNEQNCVVQGSLGINCLQAAANQFNAGDQAAGAQSGDVIGDSNAGGFASNIANWFGLGTAQVNVVGTNSSSGGSAQSPLGIGSTGAFNLLSADAPVDPVVPVVPSALGALALAGMGMLLLRRKGGSYS